MFDSGFFTVARVFRAPIRMHWSTPLGLLLGSFFQWPIALGTGLVIVLHELGHALMVKRAGARVVRIDVLPFGGRCLWKGQLGPTRRAAIAWGGVLAQLLLLLVTVALLAVLGFPHAGLLDDLAISFTLINGLFIFTNLLPVEPLDGAEAWPLLALAWRKSRRRAEATRINLLKDRALEGAEVPEELVTAMLAVLAEAKEHTHLRR
jgi:Zn-dependent protease